MKKFLFTPIFSKWKSTPWDLIAGGIIGIVAFETTAWVFLFVLPSAFFSSYMAWSLENEVAVADE